MFFYNLKTAFRYFLKQKVFVGINLLGLIIAFSVSSLIILYVINELKYDAGHKNSRQIYRVLNDIESTGNTDALTLLDLGPLIKENMPEVEKMSRIVSARSWIMFKEEETLTRSMFVDPDFVEMFTLNEKPISGTLLSEPNSVLITKKVATKLFDDQYPVGHELKIKFPQGEYFFQIKGVVDDFSKFSTINSDLLFNFQFYHKNLCNAFIEGYPFFTTFVMVSNEVNTTLLEDKINKANVDDWTGISTSKYELQRFSRMYLHSDYLNNSHFEKGNARILYGLFFLVVLLVFSACLNFGILSTACALNRSKEIGVRKITGASVKQVKRQVMFEAYLLVLLSLPIALFVTKAFLPSFNSFFSRELTLTFNENLPFTLAMTALMVITATVSGLLTSFSTGKMTPVALLKKENTKLRTGVSLNKVLLTGQMVAVIWFLAVTFLIFKQINFAQSKRLGYNPENLLVYSVNNPNWSGGFDNPQYEDKGKLEDLISSIKQNQSVEDVTLMLESLPLNDQLGSGEIVVKKSQKRLRIPSINGLANMPKMMGYKLKEGDYFSESYSGKAKNEILLNEAAVKRLGLKNPLETQISMDGALNARIVGVVYDFNFQSMRKEIVPVRIRKNNGFLKRFEIVVRYKTQMKDEAIRHVATSFNEMYKGYETTLSFHEDKMHALYEKEITEARIISLGIILAIFIAALGILGISLFSIRQQVKEIGIRKINGAETQSILTMINLGIARWVALAFIIATPLAWLSMNKWLENFAYKTTLSWWIFALAGVLALGIALLTVSWQSWRAATRNPVEALRYE